MRRIDRSEHKLADHPHFTRRTSAVSMGRLESPSGASDAVEVVSVACDGGSMTDWHSHARGQVLYVIGGRLTAIGQADGEMTLEPGEGVYTAPGEVHRHGSTTGDDDVPVPCRHDGRHGVGSRHCRFGGRSRPGQFR